MQLRGQTAVITGAASGIGLATALMFAREGADIAIVDIDVEGAARAVEEVAALGTRAIAIPTDTTDQAQTRRMARQAMEAFGRIDILISAAGFTHRSTIAEFPEDKWDAVMNVHVKGMLLCSQAVLPAMITAEYGRIVGISSLAAYQARPLTGAYTAAKHAMLGLARVMAAEFAPYGITVNILAPGTTETPMARTVLGEEGIRREIYESGILTAPPRLARPEEQAAALLYLVGVASGHVTGTTLHVNGGAHMP